jgi:hypothetical protein
MNAKAAPCGAAFLFGKRYYKREKGEERGTCGRLLFLGKKNPHNRTPRMNCYAGPKTKGLPKCKRIPMMR